MGASPPPLPGCQAIIVLAHFALNYPGSLKAVSVEAALGRFVLAVVANIAYCARVRGRHLRAGLGLPRPVGEIPLDPAHHRSDLRRHHRPFRLAGRVPAQRRFGFGLTSRRRAHATRTSRPSYSLRRPPPRRVPPLRLHTAPTAPLPWPRHRRARPRCAACSIATPARRGWRRRRPIPRAPRTSARSGT